MPRCKVKIKDKVRKWLRGKIRRGKARDVDSTAEARVETTTTAVERKDKDALVQISPEPQLSRSPSCDEKSNLVGADSGLGKSSSRSSSSVSSSDFFSTKLPPEIRQLVYIAAFGEQVLHVEMNFGHRHHRGTLSPAPAPWPNQPSSSSSAPPSWSFPMTWFSLRRLGAKLSPSSSSLSPSTTPPPAWFWWSSVCHRRPFMGVYEDRCREGGSNVHAPGHFYETHRKRGNEDGLEDPSCTSRAEDGIGVMGWLLSCKQAYTETLSILYRTNTLHMGVHTVMLSLPGIRLPKLFSTSISALEIYWDASLPLPSIFSSPQSPPRVLLGWPFWSNSFNIIPVSFPSLTRLHLAMHINLNHQFGVRNRPALMQNYAMKLLCPLEWMLKNFGGRLKDCEVVLPKGMYYALKSLVEEWRRSPPASAASPPATGCGGDGVLSVPAPALHVESGYSGGPKWERFWHPMHLTLGLPIKSHGAAKGGVGGGGSGDGEGDERASPHPSSSSSSPPPPPSPSTPIIPDPSHANEPNPGFGLWIRRGQDQMCCEAIMRDMTW